MRKAAGYNDPTAYYAMKNCVGGIRIKRGDIFQVTHFTKSCGSEQNADRPAVIVSNDTGNKFSNICEVVYLTTQEKKPLPTHVDVMCKVPSIALCEQVCTVSQDRLGEYIRTCTDKEMDAIDKALMVSLGIPLSVNVPSIGSCRNKDIDDLQMKLEGAERELDETKEEMQRLNQTCSEFAETNDALIEQNKAYKEMLCAVNKENNNLNEKLRNSNVEIRTERDLYKNLYEKLLAELVGKSEVKAC